MVTAPVSWPLAALHHGAYGPWDEIGCFAVLVVIAIGVILTSARSALGSQMGEEAPAEAKHLKRET